MSERRPTGLQAFAGNAGEPIARLNSLEGFGRSLIVGIIPLPVSLILLIAPFEAFYF